MASSDKLRRSALFIAFLAVAMEHDPESLLHFSIISPVAVLDDSQVPGSVQSGCDLSKCAWAWWALGRTRTHLLALR